MDLDDLPRQRAAVSSASLAKGMLADLTEHHNKLVVKARSPNNMDELGVLYPQLDAYYDAAWSAVDQCLQQLRAVDIDVSVCTAMSADVNKRMFVVGVDRRVEYKFGNREEVYTLFRFNTLGHEALGNAVAWCTQKVEIWEAEVRERISMPPKTKGSPSLASTAPSGNDLTEVPRLATGGRKLFIVVAVAVIALVLAIVMSSK